MKELVGVRNPEDGDDNTEEGFNLSREKVEEINGLQEKNAEAEGREPGDESVSGNG